MCIRECLVPVCYSSATAIKDGAGANASKLGDFSRFVSDPWRMFAWEPNIRGNSYHNAGSEKLDPAPPCATREEYCRSQHSFLYAACAKWARDVYFDTQSAAQEVYWPRLVEVPSGVDQYGE
jgi:hypothetical protein